MALETVPAVPLKVTVFWVGVVENPVPCRVTVVPTAPLAGENDWEEIKSLAEAVARGLEQAEPDRFIAQASKAKRKGRIFVDSQVGKGSCFGFELDLC